MLYAETCVLSTCQKIITEAGTSDVSDDKGDDLVSSSGFPERSKNGFETRADVVREAIKQFFQPLLDSLQ